MGKDTLETLKYVVMDFNGLQEKYNHTSMLEYRRNDIDGGELVMGTEDQIQFGTYECVLAKGVEQSLEIAKALRKYVCFEFGE